MKKEKSKNGLYEVAENDFATFVRGVLKLKNEKFHDELDNIISNPLYKKIVITYPRGHGKSTHLSVAFPLWLMAKNHNIRILLVSASESVARAFISEIIGHIEKDEEYQAFAKYIDPKHIGVVPKMKNYAKSKENWSGNSIVIQRDNLNLKDPSLNAIGLMGSILSKRADVVIGDDIVNQENSATEDQRRKVIDWIDTTVRPILNPETGIFVYLGNTWHQDDLVSRLLNNPQYDFRQRKKAIIHDSNNLDLWDIWSGIRTDGNLTPEEKLKQSEDFYALNKEKMDDGIEILWPAKFNYKWLYLERMNNAYAFARMYQCDPSDRPDQKFKDSWIEECCRKGAKMKLQLEKREGYEMYLTTEGLDLAISEKDSADDTVFLTIDKVKYSSNPEIKAGDIIIRNIIRGKFTPNFVKEMVKEHYEVLQPDGIRVETVGYQEAMKRDLDDMGVPDRKSTRLNSSH